MERGRLDCCSVVDALHSTAGPDRSGVLRIYLVVLGVGSERDDNIEPGGIAQQSLVDYYVRYEVLRTSPYYYGVIRY